MEEKKSLYEKFLDLGEKALKELNKPIARKRDKRAFESAVDEMVDKGYQARQKLNKILTEDVGHYSDKIDEMITLYRTEIASKEAVTDTREFYKELFGKALKMDEE